MKLIDISMTINHEMQVYKELESKKPNIKPTRRMPKDSINESDIEMNLHTGTHIDAPFHVDEKGNTIESYSVESFYKKCKVIDLTNVEDKITKEDLIHKNIEQGDFILFKTRNSFTDEFDFDFVFLERSGAEYLKEIRISGVGTDALGIERGQSGHETHKILLGNDIPIIEGLRLKGVVAGEYLLCALPLKLQGADGSPTRAVLIAP